MSDVTTDRSEHLLEHVPLLGAALAGAAVASRSACTAGSTIRRPSLFTLGFSGTINMKAWLATIVLVLVIVQVLLALWMYGKSARPAPGGSDRRTGSSARSRSS